MKQICSKIAARFVIFLMTIFIILAGQADISSSQDAESLFLQQLFTVSTLKGLSSIDLLAPPDLKLVNSPSYYRKKLTWVSQSTNFLQALATRYYNDKRPLLVAKVAKKISKAQIILADTLSVYFLASWVETLKLSKNELSQLSFSRYSEERTLNENLTASDVGLVYFSFSKQGVNFEGSVRISQDMYFNYTTQIKNNIPYRAQYLHYLTTLKALNTAPVSIYDQPHPFQVFRQKFQPLDRLEDLLSKVSQKETLQQCLHEETPYCLTLKQIR